MRRVGRNREKHRRMPTGWAPSASGVIYFRPTNAQDREIVKAITGGPLSLRLGASHDEAAETFARLVVAARTRQASIEPGTVAELCERARLEFLPSIRNPKTREERERHVEQLDKVFGARRYARNVYEASRDATGLYLRAMDVQRHLFEARGARPVAANREVRTWELVFQWARAPWGLAEYNPASGLQANPEEPRTVVPEDEKIFRLYRHLEPPARFMVAMGRYYGRRRGELLRLELTDARDDALYLYRGKDRGTKRKAIRIVWDDRLRRIWARLTRWRNSRPGWDGGKITRTFQRADGSAFAPAIVNRYGEPYSETAFNSARRRGMERAGIRGAFTFHDTRKSRAEDGLTLDQAANVLAHDDKRTTARQYRPNAPVVVDLNAEVENRRKSK